MILRMTLTALVLAALAVHGTSGEAADKAADKAAGRGSAATARPPA